MAGARYTADREDDYSKTGSTTGSHRNNPVTPVVSLSYRATPWLNAYFSGVQAVQAGGQAPRGTNNYGEVLSPIRSDQYELGVKVQRRTFSGTLAVFRMDTITPAIESSHAVALAVKLLKDKDQNAIVNRSGRGDKDVEREL